MPAFTGWVCVGMGPATRSVSSRKWQEPPVPVAVAPQIIYRDHAIRVQFLPVFPGCFVDSANRMPEHELMRAGS
jgi:hypothetical protein